MNVGINGVSGRGGRWMFSQQGGAGEVQLALASGQSFWASCRSTHHPRGHEQERSLPLLGPSLPIFLLFISKLTPCLPPAPSLPTHLRWPEVSGCQSREKKIEFNAGVLKKKKKKKSLWFLFTALCGGMVAMLARDVRWMLRVVPVVVWV